MQVVWCSVVWCGMVWCGVVRCDAVYTAKLVPTVVTGETSDFRPNILRPVWHHLWNTSGDGCGMGSFDNLSGLKSRWYPQILRVCCLNCPRIVRAALI